MTTLRYLLDTNILSYAIKTPHGSVNQHLRQQPDGAVCTSIIVACELRYGVALRGSTRLAERVDNLLQAIPVLPLDTDADQHYGEIRATLERTGKIIGQNDLIIAAHARSLGLVLVSNNVAEFERVSNLVVENWVQ